MKKVFVEKDSANLNAAKLKTQYRNKYYNLFMSSFKWNGIDRQTADYIMRKFWSEGTCAAFNIKHTNEPGFTLYTTQQFSMYDAPEIVELVNKYNVPFMPKGPQVVNKDVVIGWIQPNHKPIREVVDYYVDRLVQVDMVINTNLETHKLPFTVAASPEDIDKLQDMVDRILNNELAVFGSFEDLDRIKTLATATPYIIDKLYSYKVNLEGELLTYLGLDNSKRDDSKQRFTLDEVNSNNEEINANQENLLSYLEEFCDDIKKYLNCSTISVECRHKIATSIWEDQSNENNNKNIL